MNRLELLETICISRENGDTDVYEPRSGRTILHRLGKYPESSADSLVTTQGLLTTVTHRTPYSIKPVGGCRVFVQHAEHVSEWFGAVEKKYSVKKDKTFFHPLSSGRFIMSHGGVSYYHNVLTKAVVPIPCHLTYASAIMEPVVGCLVATEKRDRSAEATGPRTVVRVYSLQGKELTPPKGWYSFSPFGSALYILISDNSLVKWYPLEGKTEVSPYKADPSNHVMNAVDDQHVLLIDFTSPRGHPYRYSVVNFYTGESVGSVQTSAQMLFVGKVCTAEGPRLLFDSYDARPDAQLRHMDCSLAKRLPGRAYSCEGGLVTIVSTDQGYSLKLQERRCGGVPIEVEVGLAEDTSLYTVSSVVSDEEYETVARMMRDLFSSLLVTDLIKLVGKYM